MVKPTLKTISPRSSSAKSSASGTVVSSRVSAEVLAALDAVAAAEHLNRGEYISRCICQDEKIQKIWISNEKPKLSSADEFFLAMAHQVARACTLLDSLVMGIEDCRTESLAVDMLTVAEHLLAIRIQHDQFMALKMGRGKLP